MTMISNQVTTIPINNTQSTMMNYKDRLESMSNNTKLVLNKLTNPQVKLMLRHPTSNMELMTTPFHMKSPLLQIKCNYSMLTI